MEIQLQELVDKIKQDGVVKAETEASEIISDAEKKALSIINNAHIEAKELVKKATEEAERFEKAGIAAIQQASRNTMISFRDKLQKELDVLVKSETTKNYDASVLKTLIPEVVKGWTKQANTDDLTVILSSEDIKKLESVFKDMLKTEMEKGLELKADKLVSGGFRVGVKDGSAYYDLSSDAIANLFSAYLNPRVAEILKSATKES